MNNFINSKTILIVAVLLFVGVGAFVFLDKQAAEKSAGDALETVQVAEGLAPVELTADEKKALQDEGLTMPSGTDADTVALGEVRSSDAISDIEADLDETDLSGLDAEMDLILEDLSGI